MSHPRIAAALLFAFAFFQSASVRAQAPQTPKGTTQKLRNPLNDLLDEAQADFDKNDYQSALAPLQKFLAEKPDVAYVHFQLAYAYTALKRPDDARPEYEKAISLDPKMSEAYLNLGILLLETDPAAAVAPLRKAVDLLPSQSRPRYLLGTALERSGDLNGAADALEGAVHLDPKDPDALTRLGDLHLRAKQFPAAEKNFRAALEINPKSPAALQGLAQSLDAQQKPEAADAYRAYLAANPTDFAARQHLVHSLVEQKQYDAALAESEKMTAPGGTPSLETLKLRADIQIGAKQTDAAIATLQQAIAIAPQDAQLHGGLGRLYLGKRDFPNAEKEIKAAINLDKNNIIYWKDLSSSYYLSGNCPATLSALDLIARVETPNAGAVFIRALCYDKLNQVLPALDAYKKFLELDQNRNADQVWQAEQRIHVLQKKAQTQKH
jgi:Flp pilus assembly protein TadD